MTDRPLIILGASARAAAESAVRSGYRPYSIDLFGDEDLRALGPVTKIERYPAEFLAAMRGAPQAPWIYTGGLENYPRLVARLAQLRPLFGNWPATLRKVRDPLWLAEALAGGEVRYPETQLLGDRSNQSSGEWLVKPRRSGGGLGIKRFLSATITSSSPRGARYLQRFITGRSVSFSFLAQDGRATCLGDAEQWIGKEWGAPGEFQYAGSLAPASGNPNEEPVLHLAQRLTEKAGLQGVFGLDLVYDQKDWWLMEVNPRYTASMELHETLRGWPIVAQHCAAFGIPCTSPALMAPSRLRRAKLIVYATKSGIAGAAFRETLASFAAQDIDAADIPCTGSVIEASSPICTLMTHAFGFDVQPIRQTLLTAAGQIRQALQ